MSFVKYFTAALLATSALLPALAHQDTYEEIVARDLHTIKARSALEGCKRNLIENEELHQRRLAKREEFVSQFVRERGIKRRNKLPYTKRDISARSLFEEIECVLTPQATIGPYYVESTIRKDIREGQQGLEVLYDIQFVDVKTCTVVPDLYVDIWAANATGTYGGVQPENTVGETQLRGLQKTDEDGILQVISIVPGWYTGRAVHTHVLAHKGGKVDATGKYHSGGTVPHIGQLFFDQQFITEMGKLPPYTNNKYVLLPNSGDWIFGQANTGYNALVKIENVGNTLAEGIVATISIGIDLNYHNPDIGMPGLPNPTAK
ncbi:Intradiol ring-cleavage dioxygenase [Peziza echinospora]|nr:Intradiol ring-cleavage dioxygenase [Peziza echinospora]